jgi:hypothetical protein
MAMRTAAALAVAFLALPHTVVAQGLTGETDMSFGHSTDDVQAGGVQVRVFGTAAAGWRVHLEASWAGVTRPGSDAFGAAFPYDRRVRPMEVYAEKLARPGGMLLGIRAGRYRVPFGIHNRSDHGYSGFTRAPLIRYGEDWALSNTDLEAGAAVLVGVPAFSVEASLGTPLDSDETPRPRTVDAVVRLQAFHGPLIVGASVMSTRPHAEGPWVTGRTTFGGVDARWMRGGVQLRGEWIAGRPFDAVSTSGGYVDVTVHRDGMGPVTAVARAERLDYDAGEFSSYSRRYTVGARIRAFRDLSVQINLLRQPGGFLGGRPVALDLGLTQTIRF